MLHKFKDMETEVLKSKETEETENDSAETEILNSLKVTF